MRNSIQHLAHSVNYEVSYEYETVWLTRQGVQLAVVGDFYGDPSVAIIDSDEKWCAIGGSGLIVYFLEKPFDEYKYDGQSAQYFEVGRKGDDILCSNQSGGLSRGADRASAKCGGCTETLALVQNV